MKRPPGPLFGPGEHTKVYPARAVAERRVAEHFLAADAVRPCGAIEYGSGRLIRTRAFARLKACDILKHAQGGWYLDVPAKIDRRAARRKRAVVLIAAVAGAIAPAL